MGLEKQIETKAQAARAQIRSGKINRALQLYKQAVSLAQEQPEIKSDLYLEIAKVYFKAKREDTAKQFTAKALSADPSISDSVKQWGLELKKTQNSKFGDALLAFAKAAQVNSSAETIEPTIRQGFIPKKPGKVNAVGGMRVGMGVLNIILYSIILVLFFTGMIGSVISEFIMGFIGYPIIIICSVIIAFGIIEIVSGANFLKYQPDKPISIRAVSVLEIVLGTLSTSPLTIIIGIISLSLLGDPKIREYFESLE